PDAASQLRVRLRGEARIHRLHAGVRRGVPEAVGEVLLLVAHRGRTFVPSHEQALAHRVPYLGDLVRIRVVPPLAVRTRIGGGDDAPGGVLERPVNIAAGHLRPRVR